MSFNYSKIIIFKTIHYNTNCTLIKRQSYWFKSSVGSSIASYDIYFILSVKNYNSLSKYCKNLSLFIVFVFLCSSVWRSDGFRNGWHWLSTCPKSGGSIFVKYLYNIVCGVFQDWTVIYSSSTAILLWVLHILHNRMMRGVYVSIVNFNSLYLPIINHPTP